LAFLHYLVFEWERAKALGKTVSGLELASERSDFSLNASRIFGFPELFLVLC